VLTTGFLKDDFCPAWDVLQPRLLRAFGAAVYEPLGGKLPTIWHHEGPCYSTDGLAPKNVNNDCHNLLRQFLDRDLALTTPVIERNGVNNAALAIETIIKKFGDGPVRKPEGKGDGYFVRVRSLPRAK